MDWKVDVELLTPEGETESFQHIYAEIDWIDLMRDLSIAYASSPVTKLTIYNYDK